MGNKGYVEVKVRECNGGAFILTETASLGCGKYVVGMRTGDNDDDNLRPHEAERLARALWAAAKSLRKKESALRVSRARPRGKGQADG